MQRLPWCECSDPGCKNHPGKSVCGVARGVVNLRRVDMEDATGTMFCDECADDAFESGVFTINEVR